MIVWLASYPKSGNTWARIFLANYRRDNNEPININSLPSKSAFRKSEIEEALGVDIDCLMPEELLHYRPAVYDMWSRSAKEKVWLKIHDALSISASGTPLVGTASKAVLLVRNPLDVVGSLANHSGMSLAETVSWMNWEQAFLRNGNEAVEQKLRSWSGHASSWLDQPQVEVCLVRYEDLLSDPTRYFEKIVRFVGLDFEKKRLLRAISHSQFGVLQKQEERSDFVERPLSSPKFFRQGKVGAWKSELPEDLRERILSDHATMMRRLGYIDETHSSLAH